MSTFNIKGTGAWSTAGASSSGRRDIYLWTPIDEVEAKAIEQLKNVASLPWVFHHVAVMPDVHYGIGATVGSVVAMDGAVSPAAVGVDIGCGMGAVRTELRADDLPDTLDELRDNVEAAIPVGFNRHVEPIFNFGVPGVVRSEGAKLFSEFGALTGKVQTLQGTAMRQVGTLGGGNHFIELCLDEAGFVWLMLHSGSRNVGKVLAEHHISVARDLAHNQALPDRDLAVFLAGTPEMRAYRHDLQWAQRYAFFNRRVMLELYEQVLCATLGRMPAEVGFQEPILCHHNYVSEEVHFGRGVMVTRKGAISARAGELGIIPGSMGTRSYIVRGLGNEASFHSASHGAGRRMSRGEARRRFTTDDLEVQTRGVCCRKDQEVVDEIPSAYKDIDQVMRNQSDLVEVVVTLKQVLCVKG